LDGSELTPKAIRACLPSSVRIVARALSADRARPEINAVIGRLVRSLATA
jgi:hypothetical protein